MTDLATAPAPSSTTLDPGAISPSAAGGGVPSGQPAAAEPSLHDAIAAAVKESTVPEEKEAAAADPKPDEKAESAKGDAKADEKKAEPGKEAAKEAKTQDRGTDGKFTGKDAADDKAPAAAAEAGDKPDTDKRHIEAPAKFLPDAKETWRNTPRAVQRDVENMIRDHEAEVTRHREAAERYEPIRQYDDLARQNGRAGVHESLREVAELEDMMSSNPLAALNQILLRAGPRKPDGQPVSLFELAAAVVQMGPKGYQQALSRASQPQQQPQNDNSEVAQLRAEMQRMQHDQMARDVIEPFRAANPRYDELRDDIALFLKSGRIPASLSPLDRLEAAYDMAVRINPASHVDTAPAKADPDPGSRAGETFSDSKSIKSAPGAVTPEDEPDSGGSIREELEKAVRRQRLA